MLADALCPNQPQALLSDTHGQTTATRQTGRSVGGSLANIDATNYTLSSKRGTVSGGGGFQP